MYVWFYQDLSADIVNISPSPDKGLMLKTSALKSRRGANN